MDQAIPIGIYRHYKGKRYHVLGSARHSETEEVFVVYKLLYGDGSSWVRPLDMFIEEVIVDGIAQPRFQLEYSEPEDAFDEIYDASV